MRVQSPKSKAQGRRKARALSAASSVCDFGLWTLGLGLSLLLALTACSRTPSQTSAEATGTSPLSVSLSTNMIRVGDVFRATLTAVHPASDALSVPDLSQGKDLVVRNRQAGRKVLADGRVQSTEAYDLTSFVVGEHTLSTDAVQFVHNDGTTTAVPFPTARFAVQTSLTSSNAAWRDIKGLAGWPGVFPRWVTGLLLIALLAAIAAWIVHRFLTKPRTILQYAPPPPPHETALASLKRLWAKGWIESENVEPFYTELSSIVRRYLEDRFRLRAPERTTEEFIREATTSRLLSAEHQLLTSGFLEQCDLVKFARHHPKRADMQNGYDAAERLVRETTPPSTTHHSP